MVTLRLGYLPVVWKRGHRGIGEQPSSVWFNKDGGRVRMSRVFKHGSHAITTNNCGQMKNFQSVGGGVVRQPPSTEIFSVLGRRGTTSPRSAGPPLSGQSGFVNRQKRVAPLLEFVYV